jgi:iron(III) transport system substrate-binding protein
MKPTLRILIWAVLILFTVTSILYAGGSQERKASYSGTEGKITVYISGPSTMLNKLESTFEKTHGDVLELVHMGCGPLRQRVWTEFESGEIRADVFWGSDPLIYNALDDRGALEPYTPIDVAALKEEFTTDRNYTLVNERYAVIIYNKEELTGGDVPNSYEDLLASSLEGRIAHADPGQSSTALAIVAGLWDVFDRDWTFQKELVNNGLILTKKNKAVPSKIQEGEFLAGIAPHDAVFRLKKKAKKEGFPTPLEIAWPVEGAAAIQRPIAISRNEARPEGNEKIARAFVDFMISKQAQMITTKFGFVSVREDVPLPGGISKQVNTTKVDWEYLSEHQNEIREEFKTISSH